MVAVTRVMDPMVSIASGRRARKVSGRNGAPTKGTNAEYPDIFSDSSLFSFDKVC
ncbi:hypothetical protein GCM10017709_32950 [Glutamicibacter nicotianae]